MERIDAREVYGPMFAHLRETETFTCPPHTHTVGRKESDMTAQEYLDQLARGGWNVELRGNAGGWILTIEKDGSKFLYGGQDLREVASRAWAGEPPNDRTAYGTRIA